MPHPARAVAALAICCAIAGCTASTASTGTASPPGAAPTTITPTAITPNTITPTTITPSTVSSTAIRTATVATTAGYDAASVTPGKVTFSSGTHATNLHAVNAIAIPRTSDGSTPTVTGRVLDGATHAVFVVSGSFAGTTGLNTLLFGSDGARWLGLTMTQDQLQPTATALARAGEPGTYIGATLTGDGVRTSSLWGATASAPRALQERHPLVTTWKMSGTNFVPAATNVFTAATASSPTTGSATNAIPPQAGHDGTYVVRINSIAALATTVQPVRAVTCDDPTTTGCYDAVGSPFTAQLADNARTTVVSASTDVVNLSAPAWLWAEVNGDRTATLTPAMFRAGAPYVIPDGMVTSLDGMDTALVTVQGGKIVSADSIFHP